MELELRRSVVRRGDIDAEDPLHARVGVDDRKKLTPGRWAEDATALREIVDPLAAKVASAVGEQSSSIAPEGEAAMLGPVLQQMAPVLLGIQAGVALGTLATRELVRTRPTGDEDVGRVAPDRPPDRVRSAVGCRRALLRSLPQLRRRARRRSLRGLRAAAIARYHESRPPPRGDGGTGFLRAPRHAGDAAGAEPRAAVP